MKLAGIAPGNNCIIVNSVANNCGAGFFIGSNTYIEQCTASGNATGFDIEGASLLINSNANGNSAYGFFIDAASTLIGCIAENNGTIPNDAGFFTNVPGCSLNSCIAKSNTTDGFKIANQTACSLCVAENNATGFLISNHSSSDVLRQCLASNNTGAGISVVDALAGSSTFIIDTRSYATAPTPYNLNGLPDSYFGATIVNY